MNKSPNKLNQFRRFVLWMTLICFGLLLILSVVGSVRGSQRAGILFNSNPLVIYWLAFTALLIIGILIFPRLIRKPGLLLIHLGCIFVLVGSMWSSNKGQAIEAKLTGREKIPQGYMAILEGHQKNKILEEQTDKELGQLPFEVRLEDFWIEYHWQTGTLHVRQDLNLDVDSKPPDDPNQLSAKSIDQTSSGDSPEEEFLTWQVAGRVGEELELPAPLKKVRVLRVVHNLKVADRITDRPYDTINPALEISVEWADGTERSVYVFPPGMPHPLRTDGFEFVYEPGDSDGIKDYYSDLEVLDPINHVQKRKVIEVNKPLYYGRYHFYQSSYGHQSVNTSQGPQNRWYTVLSVVSNSGVSLTFFGYILLCTGVFWHCWFRHIITYFKNRSV